MEAHAEEASKAVTSATKKLQNALKQKEPDYAALELLLEKLRVRAGNLALIHLTTDNPAHEVENRLWNMHVEVNGKFKSLLKTFREGEGKKKHVERRKAEKLYVDFIKASQRFYRAYIGRLTANFTNIPKVFEVAQKLGQNGLTAQVQRPATDEQALVLDTSCKLCVIRLGDLSRWRETELQLKERNWGPARGYYQLALSLDPAEGTCYNQLAVIARNDEDHLGAVYYLHRATAIAKPFPTAPDNIKAEFDKLLVLRTEDTYGMIDRSGEDIISTLEKRFLAFHAHCYRRPYDFVAFQQKATDILDLIALCFLDTKPGVFDHFLHRACLINIAAQALAKKGTTQQVLMRKLSDAKLAQETERNCQSYFLLQRFNLMTFQALLKVLARELGEPASPEENLADLSRLSPAVRRVLPHLRQYSSWFMSHMRDLVETKFKSSRKFLEQVTTTYARTLNLLRGNVDVFTPSQVAYLLDEDEKTLSFSPFTPIVSQWRYCPTDKKTWKPTRPDNGHGKDLSEELAETHLRATDLVVDALRLVKHQDDLNLNIVPLRLVDGQFVGQEIPEAELPKPPPSPPKQAWKSRSHAHTSSMNGISESPSRPVSVNMPPPIISTPEIEMSNMSPGKGNINGTHTSQNAEPSIIAPAAIEEPPATPNSSSILTGTPAAPTTSNYTAMDLVRRMQQRSSGSSPVIPRSPDFAKKQIAASLPSVYNTPFAPTASEQAQLSPRLESSQMRSPSFTTPQISSSAVFQEQLAQQQKEIQSRSSPQASFQPTQSWMTFGQTPTGMESLFRAFESNQDRIPSPLGPSHGPANGRSPQPRPTPSQAPFGVIGQARPVSRGTPSNGQD